MTGERPQYPTIHAPHNVVTQDSVGIGIGIGAEITIEIIDLAVIIHR